MAVHEARPQGLAKLQATLRHVSRRSFLGALGAGSAVALFAPRTIRTAKAAPLRTELDPLTEPLNGAFVLPPLPYTYDALEPHIDTFTMQLHHGRHHNAYVTNLNAALANYPDLRNQNATALIAHLDMIPEAIRTTVRNNGGGHVNHSIFWAIMAPHGGGAPAGSLADAINATFGSFDAFKQQFNEVGLRRFGSGWVWLVMDGDNKLSISSTANQDSPYMEGLMPLLGNDVWEHAYYLKYQNRRADYLNAWWNTVNWHAVLLRYEGGLS